MKQNTFSIWLIFFFKLNQYFVNYLQLKCILYFKNNYIFASEYYINKYLRITMIYLNISSIIEPIVVGRDEFIYSHWYLWISEGKELNSNSNSALWLLILSCHSLHHWNPIYQTKKFPDVFPGLSILSGPFESEI